MACVPTCTTPIIGTSVPRNHSHPTRRYGRAARCHHTRALTERTKSAASATVALLFLYNAAFNLACNPLLYTYTTEILPYSIRARGLSLQIAVSEAALTVNQYVNPIALDRIGYYYYIFYLGLLFAGLAIIYLFFPETNGKTLEELSGLFVEAEVGSGGDIVKANSLSYVKNHIEAHIGNVGIERD